MSIVASTFDWIVQSIDDNPKGMALVVLFVIVIIASRTVSTTIGLGLCMQALAWLFTIGEPSTARIFYMGVFALLSAVAPVRGDLQDITPGRSRPAPAATPALRLRSSGSSELHTSHHPSTSARRTRTRSEHVVNTAQTFSPPLTAALRLRIHRGGIRHA